VKHFRGFSSVVGVKDAEGNTVKLADAIRYGWITPGKALPGWDLTSDEVPLGPNLQLDNFRQYLCYAATARSPIIQFAIQRFGCGTGVVPPTTANTQLLTQVPLVAPDSANYNTKLIDYVSYPSPFYAQIYFTLGVNDANGYLLTEFGLYSGDQTLLIRWTIPGIAKDSTFTPTLQHRLAF
jgi:hypothetical protein